MLDRNHDTKPGSNALLSRRLLVGRGAAVAGMGAVGATLPGRAAAQSGVSDRDPNDGPGRGRTGLSDNDPSDGPGRGRGRQTPSPSARPVSDNDPRDAAGAGRTGVTDNDPSDGPGRGRRR